VLLSFCAADAPAEHNHMHYRQCCSYKWNNTMTDQVHLQTSNTGEAHNRTHIQKHATDGCMHCHWKKSSSTCKVQCQSTLCCWYLAILCTTITFVQAVALALRQPFCVVLSGAFLIPRNDLKLQLIWMSKAKHPILDHVS
jgi:hypothetical protein